MPKVYVDPGHGGSDPGAVANGLQEKHVALAIARLVEAGLRRHGVSVKMSRTTDEYKSLDQRTNEANAWGANIFVSIHCNAAASASANGFEVWHSILPTSKGRDLAALIADELDRATPLSNRGTRSKANAAGRDAFHVIRETRMPAVIVECGFLTNDGDADYLRDSDGQAKIADAITRGVLRFFGIAYESQPKTPPKKYRLVTGTFNSKEAAEEAAEWLRKAKGWLVYVKEA